MGNSNMAGTKAGAPMSIDGEWNIYNLEALWNKITEKEQHNTYKIVNGSMINETKNEILFKEIARTDQNQYKCLRYSTGHLYKISLSHEKTINAISTNIFAPSYYFTNKSLADEDWFHFEHGISATAPSMELVNKKTSKEFAYTQNPIISKGAAAELCESYSIKHSVEFVLNDMLELGFGIEYLKLIKADFRIKFEQERRILAEESETKTMTIKLDGNISDCWRIDWYDIYEQGIAKYKIGNKSYDVPYKILMTRDFEVTPLR